MSDGRRSRSLNKCIRRALLLIAASASPTPPCRPTRPMASSNCLSLPCCSYWAVMPHTSSGMRGLIPAAANGTSRTRVNTTVGVSGLRCFHRFYQGLRIRKILKDRIREGFCPEAAMLNPNGMSVSAARLSLIT